MLNIMYLNTVNITTFKLKTKMIYYLEIDITI